LPDGNERDSGIAGWENMGMGFKFQMGMGMKSLKWEGTGTKNLFPHTSTMVQLMPLPLTVSCSSKIQIGLPFWYRLTQVVPEKGPLNEYMCVFLHM